MKQMGTDLSEIIERIRKGETFFYKQPGTKTQRPLTLEMAEAWQKFIDKSNEK